MNKVNWEFFLSRNKLTINDFLGDVLTLDEALPRFESRGLTSPDPAVIEAALVENAEARLRKDAEQKSEEQKPKQPKPTTTRRSKAKAAPKSSARKTRGAAKSEVKDEEESQRYFRKVVPTKKSKK